MFELLYFVIFFFFKQKTAYEMRISDWSSDVCSSDLLFDTKSNIRRIFSAQAKFIIMPPHRLSRPSPYVSSLTLLRGAKSLVLVATLVLAGCATNPSKQLAEGNSSHNIARDNYLSLTQSDPLGEIGRASCRERVCQYV